MPSIVVVAPANTRSSVRSAANYFNEYVLEFVDQSSFSFDKDAIGYSLAKAKVTIARGISSSADPVIFLTDLTFDRSSFDIDRNRKFAFLNINGIVGVNKQEQLSALIYSSFLEITSDSNEYIGLTEAVYKKQRTDIERYPANQIKIIDTIRDDYRKTSSTGIYLTHGIRTYGGWLGDASSFFYGQHGCETGSYSFKFLKLTKFLLSKHRRKTLAIELLEDILIFQKEHSINKLILGAHSFGTILLKEALDIAQRLGVKLDVECLILNGCIIDSNYKWHRFTKKNNNHSISITRVLNICGQNDYWPIFAARFVYDTGTAGTFFFNTNTSLVNNVRIKNCGHSGMLSDEHYENLWMPFIEGRDVRHKYTDPGVTKVAEILENHLGKLFLMFFLMVIFILFIQLK